MPTVVVDIIVVIIILWQTWQNHGMSALVVSGRPFVKRFTLCHRTVVCPVLSSVFCLSVLSCLSVLFVTLMYCGQTVRWITMLLGTEVGLDQATLC